MTSDLFTLPSEYQDLRDSVRALAEKEIAPHAHAVDEDHRFPQEASDALIKANLHAAHVPAEFGGEGADALAVVLIIEEVARVCASSSLIPAVNKLGSLPLMIGGDTEQKKRWLPELAKGKGFSVAPPPYVKAGNYLVKITKGNETFEKQIEVIYDSSSSFTLSERAQQQQTTTEVFNMIQDLAYLVYQIDQWDAKATEYKTKHAKTEKYVDALRMELTAMRNTLVVTTGDNYVGTAEDELREKLKISIATSATGFDIH